MNDKILKKIKETAMAEVTSAQKCGDSYVKSTGNLHGTEYRPGRTEGQGHLRKGTEQQMVPVLVLMCVDT